MSWEIDSIRRYPCPCGAGEYEEVSKSDDWGRFEESYQMLCPICAPLYTATYEEYSSKGLGRSFYRWRLKTETPKSYES